MTVDPVAVPTVCRVSGHDFLDEVGLRSGLPPGPGVRQDGFYTTSCRRCEIAKDIEYVKGIATRVWYRKTARAAMAGAPMIAAKVDDQVASAVVDPTPSLCPVCDQPGGFHSDNDGHRAARDQVPPHLRRQSGRRAE